MSGPEAHRFRFFVEGEHAAGARVTLDESDAKHLRVLRPAPGTVLEIVDGSGTLWEAELNGHEVVLRTALPADPEASRLPGVVLYAGLLDPQHWDVLVDQAVQAGAARIVPVAATLREATRAVQRVARSERVARSAAKQSKRRVVPPVVEPVALADLVRVDGPRIVLAADAQPVRTIGAVLDPESVRAPELAIFVGPASGIAPDDLARLVEAGWRAAWLGPTVLRSELASPVAVAAVLQAAHSLLSD